MHGNGCRKAGWFIAGGGEKMHKGGLVHIVIGVHCDDDATDGWPAIRHQPQ